VRSADEAYKKKEQQSWDSFSRRYTKIALPEFRPYGRRLVELAAVRPGMWVLDVATGPGEPAVTVARRVGPKGYVFGIDFSAAMLRAASARAKVAGMRHIQFRRMDAERLTFPDMIFDRVFCRFGLMLLPNAERALVEMHRVLVPGGRVAIAIWSTQRKVNTLGVIRGVLVRHNAFTPPPGAPDFFRFGIPGAIERALRRARFRRVRSERMTVNWIFDSPAEFWNSMKQGPSLKRALAQLPNARRETIREEVLEHIVRFQDHGRLRIPNEAVLAIADK